MARQARLAEERGGLGLGKHRGQGRVHLRADPWGGFDQVHDGGEALGGRLRGGVAVDRHELGGPGPVG